MQRIYMYMDSIDEYTYNQLIHYHTHNTLSQQTQIIQVTIRKEAAPRLYTLGCKKMVSTECG